MSNKVIKSLIKNFDISIRIKPNTNINKKLGMIKKNYIWKHTSNEVQAVDYAQIYFQVKEDVV